MDKRMNKKTSSAYSEITRKSAKHVLSSAEGDSFYKFFLRVTLRLCVKSFKF